VSDFVSGKVPTLLNPERRVDWIYISDVVEGLLALSDAPGLEGHTVDIGGGKLVSIRNVVALIRRLMGSSLVPDELQPATRPAPPELFADLEATHHVTGWRPRTDLETGLSRTIDLLRRPPGTEHSSNLAEDLAANGDRVP